VNITGTVDMTLEISNPKNENRDFESSYKINIFKFKHCSKCTFLDTSGEEKEEIFTEC